MRTMKLALPFFAAALLVFTGCRDRSFEKITYTANVPIYMSYDEFRSFNIHAEEAKPLTNPGKIYFYNQYIFVNDKYKGIHVINNSNPSSPQNVGYIAIPGNIDMAIKGDVLYVDSRIDMVAIDITNPMQPVEVDRLADIFPNAYPMWDQQYPIVQPDPNEGVVIGWTVEQITERRDNTTQPWGQDIIFMENQATFDGGGIMADASFGTTVQTTTNVSIGVSGSMARMAIREQTLYTVNDQIMQWFDISDLDNPVLLGELNMNRTAETISIMEEYLFIGTTTGMMIYQVGTLQSPEFVSVFAHATMCDPVVAQGDYAYVTLRGGNFCGGWGDQLDVIDISNIQMPMFVNSYSMTEPYGLGIDDDVLFVCDGDAGLKVYDCSNPTALVNTDNFPGINAYDVIPINNLLLMIGDDGLYQYEYASANNMNLLSHIPVVAQ